MARATSSATMATAPRVRNSDLCYSDEEQENVDICNSNTVTSQETPSQQKLQERVSSPFSPIQNMVTRLRQKMEGKLHFKMPNENEDGKLYHTEGSKSGIQSLNSTAQNIREEEQVEKTISPGLARLRNTPARRLRDVQKELEIKHQQTKENADRLSIGGGISIWPEMTNMRLNRTEVGYLVLMCIGLVIGELWLFNKIHGGVYSSLVMYTHEVSSFSSQHPLMADRDNTTFQESLLDWHTDFMQLMDRMEARFSISLSTLSPQNMSCVVLYAAAVIVLLYLLTDNIFAKSKLSPRRIKLWVSLLVVTGGWTLLLLRLLILAQSLEASIEDTVHAFSQQLANLVLTDLDLSLYRDVSTVWRVRCLLPSSRGVLTIMGWISIKDVWYYMQYYGVTMLTVLVTPVLQLIMALKDVYSENTSI